jgi:hypothetical protein
MTQRQRGRAVPPPVDDRTTRELRARAAAIQAALATGDPTPVRAWATQWLDDTSTIDAADDASLMESVRAAANVTSERHGLDALDAACRTVAAQIVVLATHARERLIRTLETSRAADPLQREMDRTIAAHARRLLGAEEAKTV